ncbi:MAG TPA: hypothetical protein VK694_07965 [Verrucomicrobiae bacterium]|nr:hypothetical protein [Verrucomicrobiae bacterium]
MRKQIEEGPNPAICQKWEETERGWGERPDGFSLHLSLDGLRRYIKAYWDRMPDQAPSEYSRPNGTPYSVGVSDEVAAQIEASNDGLRFYESHDYPGSGGIDGWMRKNSED